MPPCPIETKNDGEVPRTAWRDTLRLRLASARTIEETGLDPSLYGDFLSPHAVLSPKKKDLWSKVMLVKSKAKHLYSEPPIFSCKYERFIPDLEENADGEDEKRRPRRWHRKAIGESRLRAAIGKKLNASEVDTWLTTQDKENILERNAADVFDSMPTVTGKDGSVFGGKPSVSDMPVIQAHTTNTTTISSATQDVATPSDESPSIDESHNGDWVSASTDNLDEVITSLEGQRADSCTQPSQITNTEYDISDGVYATVNARTAQARARWKRAANMVTFINHMAMSIRSASTDLLEDKVMDEMLQQQAMHDDAGGVGAAAFEGATTGAWTRSKGRKGMEGLLVRQDRGILSFFQDFYVACLKLPFPHFLIGVFIAPVALGLLFTPLYILDTDGLYFDGLVPEGMTGPSMSAKQQCLAFLNIFLYALSLSTTFGGSPVVARSPFTLLVANVNTLLAQFLFVFLSGAVFARMSQPSYPIRCSKKAIIKTDDLSPLLGMEQSEEFKAFAVRLVLTGVPPCELVDVKISLTFRLFVKLPSGSVFCSTQDLELVRPEVSYLRYGLMVRHIIDRKSPLYGHTMESLHDGDASFSLTIMGTERTSMQSLFHLEDYFVHDGDVIWEGDYMDFIHINEKGQRVLDHSQIDLLKLIQGSEALSARKNWTSPKQGQEGQSVQGKNDEPGRSKSALRIWLRSITKMLESKSTSFTRAHQS